ncbi:MAG TPA: alpha/beta fold hydrolase [Actinomycetota bacterium]|nr:alpha/beta fold hydrolase [Actinomycetota bacterium]
MTGRPGPHRVSYGDHREQVADLWFPHSETTPRVVVLIHGGCWQKRYRRDLENDVAADLVARGYAVWNVEYRRLGAGGGWPECRDDVVLSITALEKLGVAIDPSPLVVVGHSAGGYLALLAAPDIPARGVVAQAPVADLRLAARLRSCTSGVGALLQQGAPSPIDEPPDLPHLLIHGDADRDVPVEIGRAYWKAVPAAEFVELPGCGHYEHLDPASDAWQVAVRWIDQLV